MDQTGMNMLSPRELDVAGLLADGLTDDEIGERLGLPLATVATIVTQLALWLGVQNRTEIVGWALAIGLSASSVTTAQAVPESPDPPRDAPAPWWRRARAALQLGAGDRVHRRAGAASGEGRSVKGCRRVAG